MAKGDNNFIKTLQAKNLDLELQLAVANDTIQNLIAYYTSTKFQGTENDYAHVTTDVLPKLAELRNMTMI